MTGIELEPTLTSNNVEAEVKKYTEQIQFLGASVGTLNGIALFTALKRSQIGVGPYPDVSLFEAANRIMTDLVILYGVRWLLHNRVFPFSSYAVEYGHGNENQFDITAHDRDQTLIGEAFNVAPSFFQGKKAAMLKKMRTHGQKATHSMVMFNADAVHERYLPSPSSHGQVYHVLVDVGVGTARLLESKVTDLPKRAWLKSSAR